MSPFVLQPILMFTFQHSSAAAAEAGTITPQMQIASKQGCQFLRVLFFNMFIADPHDALQDVMEINFGFQLTSIAGVSVEQIKKDKENAAAAGNSEAPAEGAPAEAKPEDNKAEDKTKQEAT